MINLGLSYDERKAFERALVRARRSRVTVSVRNRDEQLTGTLTQDINQVLGGSVDVDAEADVTRQLHLDLFDTKHKIVMDVYSPSTSAIWPSHFIEVQYGVWVANDPELPTMRQWVDVPVFWGPLDTYERSGSVVKLTALGKESLYQSPNTVWDAYEIVKGTKLTDAFRTILGNQGETRYLLPELPDTTKAKWNVKRGEEAWISRVKAFAEKYGPYHAFFNGRGEFVMRDFPYDPIYTFRRGESGEEYDPMRPVNITTQPAIAFHFEDLRNTIHVLGQLIGETQIEATAIADDSNPLGPGQMARNGKRRYLVEEITTEHDDDVSALTYARKRLNQTLIALNAARFDAVPIPHLEELDTCILQVPGENDVRFALTSWSLPLTGDADMSVGYIKRVPVRGLTTP